MNAPLHKDANEPAGPSPAAPHSSVPSGEILPPVPGAQPPIETEGTRLGKSSQAAAGMKAVINTFTYAWGQMGLARGTSSLLKVNQANGFDCQSCAWPSPDHDRHAFEFCENGVKALADEGMRDLVGAEFFRRHSIQDLLGRSDYWLNQQGRLSEPMIRREGATHFEPISWDDAFTLLGRELRGLASPWESALYTSGRASNEAAFLWQLFARQMGHNNLPDCSNMCHESSGTALNEQIGIGKGCVSLDDFEKTDLVFVIGQNPGTNHPRMLSSLAATKAKGGKIISVNPLPEVGNFRFVNPQDFKSVLKAAPALLGKGDALSDLWLQVRIHSDMALLKGIMKEMLAAEDAAPGTIFDHAFIREHTTGYDELLADLRATAWDRILADTGLNRDEIKRAAEMTMAAKSIIICWAMGLTQLPKGVATIQACMNLLLLGGHIGRPGAGPCPVRGHSNVQGDRTMGIWEKPSKIFLERLGKEFQFAPPEKHGLDTVEAIEHMHQGKLKVFVALGGSFLSATPDTEFTARALQNLEVSAHVATKLNRGHLITGKKIGLILPCLGRSEIDRQGSGEQFVTVEDSMGVINMSRGHLEPISPNLRSEPAFVCGLARATLGPENSVNWEEMADNYDRIRDRIERVIPGFEQFNERVRRGPFWLPNAPRDARKWNNAGGKARFIPNDLPDVQVEPGQLVMMTIRTHDQFNTTVYGLDDRYRGVYNGRRVIFMNPQDIHAMGLQTGQLVDLTSHFRGEKRVAERFLVTPYQIPRGASATYFPEANVLVPLHSTAERSNTPTVKYVLTPGAPSLNPTAAAQEVLREARETRREPKLQPA